MKNFQTGGGLGAPTPDQLQGTLPYGLQEMAGTLFFSPGYQYVVSARLQTNEGKKEKEKSIPLKYVVNCLNYSFYVLRVGLYLCTC